MSNEVYFITVKSDNCKLKKYFTIGQDVAKKALEEESEKLIQKTIKINHLSRAEAEKYRRSIHNKTIHDKDYMTISDLNGKWEVIMNNTGLRKILERG